MNGTPSQPVIFTSVKDDTYGGDTNNDGANTVPEPENWHGIMLQGQQAAHQGIGEFDWAIVRYGGQHWGNVDANINFHFSESGHFNNSISEFCNDPALIVTESSVDINNSTFRNSNSYGVYFSAANSVVRGSTFENNGGNAIRIENASNIDLGANDVSDMGLNTFFNNDAGGNELYNNTDLPVNAYYNIWEYTDAVSINEHIYDNDDNSWHGIIHFDPWFDGDQELSLISDELIDFGTVSGVEIGYLPVVIENTGDTDINLWEVSFAEDDQPAFTHDYTCELISSGTQDTIWVTFNPSTDGIFSDILSIYNSSTNQPIIQITLQGNGEDVNIEDEVIIPVNDATTIYSNYPNPFNPETSISFNLENSCYVSLQVFDIRGRLVSSLVNEILIAGKHEVTWKGIDRNGKRVASGMYFYRMKTKVYSNTKKMLLLK